MLFGAVAQLARAQAVQPTLLHVYEAPAVPATEAPMVVALFALNDELVAQCRQQLAKAVEHPSLAGLNPAAELIANPSQGAAQELADFAARGGFDLILTLAKRRSRLDKFLEGTSLMRIVRNATIPVLTLPPQPMPVVQRVIFATDFSAEAAHVLRQLAPLVQGLGASLNLVRIYTRQGFESTREFKAHLREFHDELAQADLDAFKQIQDSVAYYADDLVQGIVQCAEDYLADLIVLATHGRKGLSLLLSGSVTEEVVERSSVPTLIYRLPES